MGIGLACSPHPLEIFGSGQSKTFLHPRLISSPRIYAGDLPTSPLDVFVGSNGKFVAALEAAALEHIAPVGGCHACAETVHTHTAADLGLVRSLGHSTFFLLLVEKISTQSPVGWYFGG